MVQQATRGLAAPGSSQALFVGQAQKKAEVSCRTSIARRDQVATCDAHVQRAHQFRKILAAHSCMSLSSRMCDEVEVCVCVVLIAHSESFYGVLKSRVVVLFLVCLHCGVASDFIAQLMGLARGEWRP